MGFNQNLRCWCLYFLVLLLPICNSSLYVYDSWVQVPPKEIPSPKHSGLSLNAYMLHNLAHVELNAIDLAWDTVVRFSPYSDLLGDGFFADFAHVADDESRHFAWCCQRLSELGVRWLIIQLPSKFGMKVFVVHKIDAYISLVN